MLTFHIIPNAHLDPVWLWDKREGLSQSIRTMRSRWGSCSREGNISLNCLLMLAPPEVRDATVVHELCHRRHMDHSRAFYQEVEHYCPGYRKTSRWLKEHGPALISRLPARSS